MTSCLEKNHFLCQVLHECGEFKYLEEMVSDIVEQNTYKGYKGRGLIQLTGLDNYKAYGAYVGEDFTNENRKKIATMPQHAVGSAIWYWHFGKSKDFSSLVNLNDFISITALINGGFNGYDERKRYFDRGVKNLKIKDCKNFPVEIINNISNFDFTTSYIYPNRIGECFGWGLWNDPLGKKTGKSKDVTQAKLGYERFLIMAQGKEAVFGYQTINKKKVQRTRYGYSGDKAVAWAKQRVSEL